VEYRSFDGTNNNRVNPTWGVGGIAFLRGDGISTYPTRYVDDSGGIIGALLPPLARLGADLKAPALASPREISNKLFGLHPENKASFPITVMHIYWVRDSFPD